MELYPPTGTELLVGYLFLTSTLRELKLDKDHLQKDLYPYPTLVCFRMSEITLGLTVLSIERSQKDR